MLLQEGILIMDMTFLKAVLKGALIGLICIAAVSIITALALTMATDPLALITACAMIADFAGGAAAAVAAVSFRKQKPLPTAVCAGAVVCLALCILSLISGCVDRLWSALAITMLGSLIGALVPVIHGGKRRRPALQQAHRKGMAKRQHQSPLNIPMQ